MQGYYGLRETFKPPCSLLVSNHVALKPYRATWFETKRDKERERERKRASKGLQLRL